MKSLQYFWVKSGNIFSFTLYARQPIMQFLISLFIENKIRISLLFKKFKNLKKELFVFLIIVLFDMDKISFIIKNTFANFL